MNTTQKILIITFLFFLFSCSESENKNPIENEKTEQETTKIEDSLEDYSDSQVILEGIETKEFEEDLSPKKIKFEIDHRTENGLVYITGTTNLPENTKLGVRIENNKGYYATDLKVYTDSEGNFSSNGFSNKGKKLIGKYEVEVITYFNKVWQKTKMLEMLNLYEGKPIKIVNDEIYGKQKQIELKKRMNFGSNTSIKNNEKLCREKLKEMSNLIAEIKKRKESLQKLHSSNSKDKFDVLIASWNRESRNWKDESEAKLKNQCCPSLSNYLSMAITNLDLLGLAYASVYEDGKKDIKHYNNEINSLIEKSKQKMKDCE